MNEYHWKLDEALGLVVSSADVDRPDTVVTPEQTIDTVLLRNLEEIPKALFGAPGRFIFHSAIYWGAFDVCCILADRRLVAFENKGRRLTKQDFRKFCRDVRKIQSDGIDYVQERFQHVLNYLSDYMTCAERMFAAAFLGVRCDIEKDARSLSDEACSLLSVRRDVFVQRFHSRNGWLEKLGASPDFGTYLADFAGASAWRKFIPILLVPAADIQRVQAWSQELDCDESVTAHLATYKFGIDDRRVPTSLSVRHVGQFVV